MVDWAGQDVSRLTTGNPRWYAVADLSKLFPEVVEDLLKIVEPIDQVLQIALEVIQDALRILAALTFLVGGLPGILTTALVQAIESILRELEAAGVYILWIDTRLGGSDNLVARFQQSMRNPDDTKRPLFDSGGAVGSISFIIGGPSLEATKVLFQAIGDFFSLASDALKQTYSQQAPPKTKDLVDYRKHYFTELRFKNDKNPLRWQDTRVIDLFPGADEIFGAIRQWLKKLQKWELRNPFERLAAMIEMQIAEFSSLITLIDQLLDAIRQFIADGPIDALLIPPATGGTSAWMTKMNQGLKGGYGGLTFGNQSYAGGLIIVIGGSALGEAQVAWEVLMRLWNGAFTKIEKARKVG